MSSRETHEPLPVAEALEARWGPDRSARVLQRVHAQRAWQARARRVAAFTGALVLFSSAGLGVYHVVARPPQAVVVDRSVRFSDGSRVRLLDADSALDVGTASDSSVDVTLRSGRALFEITPNPARRFNVHAGPADVSVLGTEFFVQREATRVRVEVVRGRVAVAYAGGSRLLTDGESNWFPPSELNALAASAPGVAAPAPTPPAEIATPAVSELSARPSVAGGAVSLADPRAERRWFLDQARHGNYAEAYAAIERSPDLVGNSADELMLAADAARLSGHLPEGVRFLERVTREHARESVAPLAAFTLGRMYLSQLGQPARAADAFELSLKLAPRGSLAEDALARAVESAASAGQATRARQLAELYLGRFPHGRRLDSVQKSGGLLGNGANRP